MNESNFSFTLLSESIILKTLVAYYGSSFKKVTASSHLLNERLFHATYKFRAIKLNLLK